MFSPQPWHRPCSLAAVEIQDGFIVSIFNYCDRWCERCPLTARCRVFAMRAEQEFESDHGPLTEPMAERQAQVIAGHDARWEKELGLDFADIQRRVDRNPEEYRPPDLKFEHLELEIRSQDFADDLWRWLKDHDISEPDAAGPMEDLHHFWCFVPTKIHRALEGLAEDEPLEFDSDAHGSAKAALLGLERMRRAWDQLIAEQFVTGEDVAPLLNTTAWLIEEIDRLIPQARAFIRPGLDELDEVKKLMCSADLLDPRWTGTGR